MQMFHKPARRAIRDILSQNGIVPEKVRVNHCGWRGFGSEDFYIDVDITVSQKYLSQALLKALSS